MKKIMILLIFLATAFASKPTIAVLGGGSSYDASFLDLAASQIRQDLQQQIIAALIATKKFRVLDRDTPDLYEAEKEMILSEDAETNALERLNKVLGADYFVLFDIKDIGILQNKSKISSNTKKAKFYAMLDFRIFTMATREIKFANSINVEFIPKTNLKNKLGLYNEAIKELAGQLTAKLLEDFYPAKIIKLDENRLILDKRLELNEVYECFSDGVPVAVIKIDKNSAKLSYASILSGEIERENICKKMQNPDDTYKNKSSQNSQNNVQINESGGVILPF